ncbi:MAG: hypothetical protein Q9203_007697 [Teloschistes exilis]
MPLRPREGLEHGEKRERETQDHTDGLRARGDGAGHRELVEQPDRYEQETEDAESDEQGREGGDTAPAIVVDFRMGCGETYDQKLAAKIQQNPLNQNIKPSVVAPGAKGHKVLLLIDEIHLRFVQLPFVRLHKTHHALVIAVGGSVHSF